MADLDRIAAELRAAITLLQARQASLTTTEQTKLESLLLNLERVLAAKQAGNLGPNTGCEDDADCLCVLCQLE
jgi:hypothetical protein